MNGFQVRSSYHVTTPFCFISLEGDEPDPLATNPLATDPLTIEAFGGKWFFFNYSSLFQSVLVSHFWSVTTPGLTGQIQHRWVWCGVATWIL